MSKRGENIYKRGDGRWEGRYRKGRKSNGKLIYGYVYARKYSDCKEKLERAKELHRHIPNTVKKCGTGKVSEYMEFWLSNVAKPNVKLSTFCNYTNIVEKWLLPHFGKRSLYKLGRDEVQCFIAGLSRNGLSSGTIRNIFNVLHSVMKKAQEFGFLTVNACEGVFLPREEKKEIRLLTIKEQKRLEQAAREDKNGFAILLASYTGLRVGEICGLTWEDVDLEQGVLRVSRTIQRIQCHKGQRKTFVMVGSTKSVRSTRTFPLPPAILKLFQLHRETHTGEYVFEHRGHPLEPRVLQYRFQALLKKAGLPHIRFHALRHIFATRCMELSFDVKTLSEILGHSSAKMTLDLYGHSQMRHKRSAMESLDVLFHQSA